MKTIILIFLGGGSGAVTRYVATILGGRVFGAAHNFYSIMSVNVIGSLLMGMLVGYMWRHDTNLNETTTTLNCNRIPRRVYYILSFLARLY